MPASPGFRLAFATSVLVPGIHPDDARLADCLRERGIEPTACVWNDPAVDWAGFDAVLMRTTWDYFQHYAAFLHWLDRLPVPLINDRALVRWNSDKRYLLDLAAQGVDIIPTRLATAADLPACTRAMAGQELIVKPTVSGTAWHTVRGRAGEPAFEAALAALPRDFRYLVQPFLPEVLGEGEWSLLFFGGHYSHAVIKRPAAGDFRVQSDFGGTSDLAEPPVHVLASAQRALAATASLGHTDIAYARVDGVVADGGFRLMELEMIEPYLHLGVRPDAAERFAAQLGERLAGRAVAS
jgi:glutathione synthase/RimK-type ligase-like ATP-grasp enzyme